MWVVWLETWIGSLHNFEVHKMKKNISKASSEKLFKLWLKEFSELLKIIAPRFIGIEHHRDSIRDSPHDFLNKSLSHVLMRLFILSQTARSQSSLSHTSPALQGAHNASTATKELDDLMASLSDFKVSFISRKTFFLRNFCAAREESLKATRKSKTMKY